MWLQLISASRIIFVPIFSLTESVDYSSTTCDSQTVTQLNLNDPGLMDSEVRITAQADNRALEGTEELRLGFQLTPNTQNAVNTSRNIFFQNTSVQIGDNTGMCLIIANVI